MAKDLISASAASGAGFEHTPSLPPNLQLSDFELGKTVGTGSFGRVCVATHKHTGTFWAIKQLAKTAVVETQQVGHILSERNILLQIEHPFIVNMAATFQDSASLYLVLEYVCGGEFFTHLREKVMLEVDSAKFYAAQVASIFAYLHERRIIYRDLKPENMLLDASGYLKLTDFGFAKICSYKTYTLCGTPEYIAPEILLGKGHGKGVDWWTLGILLYEMLCGQPPFIDDDPMGIYKLIMEGYVGFPAHVDRSARSLIKKLLTADLTRRYGCLAAGSDDVLYHRFFRHVDFDTLKARTYHELDPDCCIIPKVSGPQDTSMFDDYPDEDSAPREPVFEDAIDPFVDF